MDLAQLVELRNKLWHQAKDVLDKAEGEKRNLTGEEKQEYDRLCGEIDALGEQIATAERKKRAEEIEAEMRSTAGRRTAPAPVQARPQASRPDEALRCWLTRPAKVPLTAEQVQNARDCGVDLNDRGHSLRIGGSRGEQRAMSTTAAGAGGEWDVDSVAAALDRALLAFGGAKALVRTLTTSTGVSLPIPTVNDTANSAVIVAEEGAIGVTPDPTTGSVSLAAFMYSTNAIKVSLQLLQDSVVPLAQLLPDLLAERLGRAVNAHIIGGTGVGQPNGIFPRATASGVVVGGTVAAPTFSGDNFIDLMHAVDPAYRNMPGAGFIMHDTIVQRVRKLKDSNNQYLWQPSMQLGQPDRLLGYPLYVNQAAPTLNINARIASFGDYTKYTWREVSQLDLYRLDELYIMTGQIAFVGLYRADGNLINTAAVKTLAAPAA